MAQQRARRALPLLRCAHELRCAGAVSTPRPMDVASIAATAESARSLVSAHAGGVRATIPAPATPDPSSMARRTFRCPLTQGGSPVREIRTPGSVRGAARKGRPYRDCTVVEVGVATVERVRRRCIERGVAASLDRKPQDNPSRPRKLDGASEAKLVQVACSAPPAGRARWTLSLLADRLVELKARRAALRCRRAPGMRF